MIPQMPEPRTTTGWAGAVRALLPTVVTIGLFVAAVYLVALPAFERHLLQAKRDATRELTRAVASLVDSYAKGIDTSDESAVADAQRRALERVRKIRYGPAGKDYFWINDQRPVMLMHPYRTELEGHNVGDHTDPDGKALFKEFIDVVQRYGGGYVDYQWYRHDELQQFRKTSYVHACGGDWDWIVGTGLYTDDVEAQIDDVVHSINGAIGAVLALFLLMSAYIVAQAVVSDRRRLRAEAEREQLREQLIHSQRLEAVGQLAGGIAHDFNNLLQAILGASELAMRELPADGVGHRELAGMRKAADRAATLTRQLLAFSRRQMMQPSSVDLRELLDELTTLLQRVLGESIELTVGVDDDLEAVRVDRSMIEQVLMNLFVNARDAMPGGGRLVVELRNTTLSPAFCAEHAWADPGRYVRLSVHDTGHGMQPEVRERVFDPFYSTKPPEQGSGLGLAMVYGIVKQHAGLIDITSAPGEGTTFDLYLPATPDPPAVVEPPTDPSVPVIGGSELLLVAEDDEQIRELSAQLLREQGYEVLLARDGEEAVRLFLEHRDRIALVVLDAVMPRLGGWEAHELIRRERADVPVLFSSGYATEEVMRDLPPSADRQVLAKPYAPSALLRTVRAMLDARSSAPARRGSYGANTTDA